MREPSPYFIHRRSRPEMAAPPTASPFLFEQPEEGLDLWKYWETIRRHLRLVLAVFLGAILLTGLHLAMMVPLYTARTTVLIGPDEPNIVESRAVRPEGATAVEHDYYSTQRDILKSRSLAARVIRSEHLESSGVLSAVGKPGLLARLWDGIGERSMGGSPTSVSPPLELMSTGAELLSVKPELVDAYLARLKITPVEETSLVVIGFTTTDSKISAEVADAHVREYIRQGIEIHSQAHREAERFLNRKLVQLKDRLEKSEVALNDYRRAKGIIPGLMSLNGKDAVVLDRLADLSKDLTTARVARISLEAQLQLIRKKQYDSLPAVMSNSLIQNLESQLNELYAQSASLSNQFKPDYPPLAQLQAKLRETQDRLNKEIRRVIGGIESSYQEATEKERRLEAEMDRQRNLTLSLNDAAVQYAILQREVDTNRQLYDSVLKAMKDVGVLAEAQTTNVSIIDRAEAPEYPSSPRPVQDLLLAAALGMVGALGLAFFLDYLDNTFKGPEEVEAYLRVPALAVVPEFSRRGGEQYSSRRLMSPQAAGEPSLCQALSTRQGFHSSLVEAYRNFRTALLLSRAGSPPKTTLITSAFPREGKTVTAVNTAVMFAQLGSKVLLVDADLRRPRCHHFFSLDNRLGLTEILTGARDVEEIVRPTALTHLFFLGAGSIPPNPTELLGSDKMVETLRHLEEQYDYIVIDSPPVMPVSDALLLSIIVDGVALVADGAQTPRQQVKAACSRLEYARAKILGVVLNKTRFQSHYYHYYSGYYSGADVDSVGSAELEN